MDDTETLELACPDVDKHHQPGIPEAYVQRQEWFVKMRKTHTQKRCQSCALWVIWVKKGSTDE